MKTGLNNVVAVASIFGGLTAALTPEGMLATPRRSPISPNTEGSLGAFTSTSYNWTSHKSSTTWNLMNLTTGAVTTIFNGSAIAEMVWLPSGPYNVLYVNGTNAEDDGGVSVYAADVRSLDQATFIASLPAPYSGFKAVQTANGDIHWLANAQSYPNGTVYNEQLVEEPLSSARIYTSIYVRHWDRYLSDKTYAVFGGVINRRENGSYYFDGQVTNYVTGIKNVTTAETPVQPFGDQGDYDISPDGSSVIFLTKNPDLPLANFTSSLIYHVPFNGTWKDAVRVNGWGNQGVPSDARGATAAPRFSHNGQYIGYLQMDGISYESDKARLYVATSTYNNYTITPIASDWDRGPDQLQWAIDDSALLAGTPDRGRERIFSIPVNASADYVPQNITDEGYVSAFTALPISSASYGGSSSPQILVTKSYVYSPTEYSLVSADGQSYKKLFEANLVDPALSGLGPEDFSEFYFEGNFTQVQSWIVYPENFDANKSYPLAFLVHGGPQVPWFNSWSTRWNLKTWADQGYVVIAPNPTASPGWGQAFVDAIQNNWGGAPYNDLERCWEYVDANLSYVDTSRGIEAGASYGGYMTNWIQGQPLGRKFRALVTHDGSTNTNNQYATEELWFMQHDFNGTIWDDRANYERWNPIDYINNWATPHFVVHSDLDYRLPVAEGIYLFNVLQEKGVPSKLLNFPDETHWVLNRENSIVWHREIYRWINYYSGVDNSTGPY